VTAGRVQIITTVLKILPLTAISVFGLFYFDIANLQPANLTGGSNLSAIFSATTLTFFAFLGIECATIPADHVENPQKIIPRATKLGVIITTVVYLLGSLSVMSMIPLSDLQSSNAPFADAAIIIWGEGAQYFVALGAMISIFGALNGWILIQGQIPKAVAGDGLFPKIFERLNRFGSPHYGIAISSLLITILILMNYTKGLVKAFEFMILLTTLTVLIPYLFSVASYVIILRKQKGRTSTSQLLMAAFAFLFSLGAVIGSGAEIVFYGFILLLLGIPIYVQMNKKAQ
jgi:APA family basic amino acid/polyamine antiporter